MRSLSTSASSSRSRWRSYWEAQRCSMVRSSTDAWLSTHWSGGPPGSTRPPFLSWTPRGRGMVLEDEKEQRKKSWNVPVRFWFTYLSTFRVITDYHFLKTLSWKLHHIFSKTAAGYRTFLRGLKPSLIISRSVDSQWSVSSGSPAALTWPPWTSCSRSTTQTFSAPSAKDSPERRKPVINNLPLTLLLTSIKATWQNSKREKSFWINFSFSLTYNKTNLTSSTAWCASSARTLTLEYP